MYETQVILDLQEDAFHEVARQEELWGVQTHPDGTGTQEFRAAATEARILCDNADAEGECTWAHILLEEVYEALAESNVQKLLEELTQAAAVIHSWQRAILTRD